MPRVSISYAIYYAICFVMLIYGGIRLLVRLQGCVEYDGVLQQVRTSS